MLLLKLRYVLNELKQSNFIAYKINWQVVTGFKSDKNFLNVSIDWISFIFYHWYTTMVSTEYDW